MKGRFDMESVSKNVETRAEGRPPEEAESEGPEEQAKAILEESEARLESGARRSAPQGARGGPCHQWVTI